MKNICEKNYRNKLQEYCDKHKLPHPNINITYLYENKNTYFISNCVYDGIEFFSPKYIRKNDSVYDVCQSVYEFLISKSCVKQKYQDTLQSIPFKSCIIIDLENRPKMLEKCIEVFSDTQNLNVIAVCSSNFKKNIQTSLPNNFILKQVKCSLSDSADISIIIMISNFIINNIYDKIFIVSHDHFANTLINVVDEIDYIIDSVDKPECTINQVSNISELLTFFEI